jgi:hypothetical protein
MLRSPRPRSERIHRRRSLHFPVAFLLKVCDELAGQVNTHVVRSGCEAHAIVLPDWAQLGALEVDTRLLRLALRAAQVARPQCAGGDVRQVLVGASTWSTVIGGLAAHPTCEAVALFAEVGREGKVRPSRSLGSCRSAPTPGSWTKECGPSTA